MIHFSAPQRRQARFLSERVIVPSGIEPAGWYDIAPGRRAEDRRPGMALLVVGGRRMLVSEACLEFRDVAVLRTRAAADRLVRVTRTAGAVLARPRVALAASVLAAVVAVGRYAMDR